MDNTISQFASEIGMFVDGLATKAGMEIEDTSLNLNAKKENLITINRSTSHDFDGNPSVTQYCNIGDVFGFDDDVFVYWATGSYEPQYLITGKKFQCQIGMISDPNTLGISMVKDASKKNGATGDTSWIGWGSRIIVKVEQEIIADFRASNTFSSGDRLRSLLDCGAMRETLFNTPNYFFKFIEEELKRSQFGGFDVKVTKEHDGFAGRQFYKADFRNRFRYSIFINWLKSNYYPGMIDNYRSSLIDRKISSMDKELGIVHVGLPNVRFVMYSNQNRYMKDKKKSTIDVNRNNPTRYYRSMDDAVRKMKIFYDSL